MSILILNGSPQGVKGNCHEVIQKILAFEKAKVLHLAEQTWSVKNKKDIFKTLEKSKGFIFITGTYWDSWGSPLQIFLENITELEGTSAFMGKPAMVIVLNHSVGGKSVLSRLQGVLSTLGCLIPPMSGMVYAWVTQELLKTKNANEAAKDLWSLDDLEPMLENFHLAINSKVSWKNWPVDRKDFRKKWLKI